MASKIFRTTFLNAEEEKSSSAEESRISTCIQSFSDHQYVAGIIVVDAGSNDQTHILAQQAGVQIRIHEQPIDNGGGRGGQIKTRGRATHGNVVANVHADKMLPGVEIDQMIATLRPTPLLSAERWDAGSIHHAGVTGL